MITKEELEILSKLKELDAQIMSLLRRLKELGSDLTFHYSFEMYIPKKSRKKNERP